MKRQITTILVIASLALPVSCAPLIDITRIEDSRVVPAHILPATQISFEDRTEETVAHARKLITKNETEGAVLDQRWYGFRRFGQYQDLILGATKVIFCGGREGDVQSELGPHYESIRPLEGDQDPGEIRLYAANRSDGTWDFLIIGQNGREVALKTVIRFLYIEKFLDSQAKQKYRDRLQSFDRSLKVLMSSRSARDEFIGFFKRNGIYEPDAVIIGFMSDSAYLMRQEGLHNANLYTDESLRVNWYNDVYGKKVLLVSINGNRIFASRAGQLMEAIFDISPRRAPAIAFFGSAGVIDHPELVWQIAAPISVTSGDLSGPSETKGELLHLISNRAASLEALQTTHASIESVVAETTEWAKTMKKRGIKTVDQELLHVIRAVQKSRYGNSVVLFAGILVTDNISSNPAAMDITLERAEDTISEATPLRRDFLYKILKAIGILRNPAALNDAANANRSAGGARD